MALGGYLSARTARQILDQRIATERYEIEHEPDEERAELRAIYRDKGLSGPLLDRVVGHLTADRERWHRAMVMTSWESSKAPASIRGWKACRLGSPSWSVASSQRCRCCSLCRRPDGGPMDSQRSPPWSWERSKPATPIRVLCGLASNFSWSSPWGRWPVWGSACSCMQDKPDVGASAYSCSGRTLDL